MQRSSSQIFTCVRLQHTTELDAASQDVTQELSTLSPRSVVSDSQVPEQSIDSVIPDGGYGYVVLAGCSVIIFWFGGTSYSWGIIQAALVEDGVSEAGTLSFVGSFTVACISLFAIINAKMMTAIGARRTGLLGISLLSLGEILGGFATKNVGGLFATVGIVMGIGTSLCFMTISTIPAQYFLHRLGLANGIVYAGGGIGGTAISLIVGKSLSSIGTAWTLRLLGILTFVTGMPAAYLLRDRAPLPKRDFVEWSLFKSLKFDLLFASGLFATFPLFVPPFFLPLYCRSIGLSPSTGAAMVATFNFSSAVGRITLGLCCDQLGPLNSLFASLFLSAASMLALWPFSDNIALLVIFVIINGVANGGFFAVMPTVVSAMFGPQKVAVVMGMIVTGWAGGYLLGGPIAGYMLQAFGGAEQGLLAYRPAMYYAGSMSMGAAILVAAMRVSVDKKIFKKA